MGQGPEETFFQRRHTNGQQVHEKVLSIPHRQGNENQNHRRRRPRPVSVVITNKRQQALARMWRKGTCCWWGCKLGNSTESPQEMKPLYDMIQRSHFQRERNHCGYTPCSL